MTTFGEQVEFVRAGGRTKRYHTQATLKEQTVASHSFGVAMLVWSLCGHEEPGVRMPLIMAALCHDLGERDVLGDVPAPGKRKFGRVTLDDGRDMPFREAVHILEEEACAVHQLDWDSQLTEEERRILKLADAAEGALYCIEELAMGNRLIRGCLDNYWNYIREVIDVTKPVEAALYHHIEDMREQYDG